MFYYVFLRSEVIFLNYCIYFSFFFFLFLILGIKIPYKNSKIVNSLSSITIKAITISIEILCLFYFQLIVIAASLNFFIVIKGGIINYCIHRIQLFLTEVFFFISICMEDEVQSWDLTILHFEFLLNCYWKCSRKKKYYICLCLN